ncbi:hypothetical protein WJX74_002660 [Apatococcus lobatus]|uniref:Uncharacterized protein n=1 Tax=Apatococcus lobatus TaxID=904363 RepID=A0AAW1S2P8_9CHLO
MDEDLRRTASLDRLSKRLRPQKESLTIASANSATLHLSNSLEEHTLSQLPATQASSSAADSSCLDLISKESN